MDQENIKDKIKIKLDDLIEYIVENYDIDSVINGLEEFILVSDEDIEKIEYQIDRDGFYSLK